MKSEVLYRYYEVCYSLGCDEWDNPYQGYKLVIQLTEYPIIKRTPKGAWIDESFAGKRFVLLTARKKYACSSKEEALESFKARKRRQINILKEQLSRAISVLGMADSL